MKKLFPTYILGVATFLLGTMAIISAYEALFLMPRYFSNPPVSFSLWKENADLTSKVLWIPLQTGVIVTLILSLIFNWKYSKRKVRLIIVISSYLLIWAVSLAYFVPHVKEFINMPATTVVTRELSQTISTWRSLTWFRQIFLLASYIGLLTTLATPAKTQEILK